MHEGNSIKAKNIWTFDSISRHSLHVEEYTNLLYVYFEFHVAFILQDYFRMESQCETKVWNSRLWYCWNYQYGSCVSKIRYFSEIFTGISHETGEQVKSFYNKNRWRGCFTMLVSLFDNKKSASLQLYCKRFHHRCFTENFAKYLRISILEEICKWLVLFSCWNNKFVVFQFT